MPILKIHYCCAQYIQLFPPPCDKASYSNEYISHHELDKHHEHELCKAVTAVWTAVQGTLGRNCPSWRSRLTIGDLPKYL